MNANELRIGNYVETNIESKKYKEIDVNHLDISLLVQFKGRRYKPIPITEQWLIDLGFTKPRSIIVEYKKNGFELYFITTDDFYQAELGSFTIDVKFVHQLQNLYFALVGEELTKLKP